MNPELIDARPKSNMTPLLEAAYKGHSNLVTFFLERGCDVNEIGFEGYTPLMMACLGLRSVIKFRAEYILLFD